MKWVEWNPMPLDGSSAFFPKNYSKGLTQITLVLLIPMAILGFLSSDWPLAYQLLPIYLSLFVFGMPHGGADHLIIWGMIRQSSLIFRIGTLLVYPTLSLLYLALWHHQAIVSAIFFLAMTIFHWGQGDRYLSVKLHQALYLKRSVLLGALHILSRGSLPILLPGYLGNETYKMFLEAMIRQGGSVEYDLSLISQFSYCFLLIPSVLTVLQLLLSSRKLKEGEGRAFALDCLESLFLFLWFLLVPPLWALGSYFSLWHSLRHGLRILWMDSVGQQYLLEGSYFRLKGRWLQITGLMTFIALVGMWFMLSLPLSFKGIELDWLGKAMLGISVLTLPHTVVVCLMDHFQLRSLKPEDTLTASL